LGNELCRAPLRAFLPITVSGLHLVVSWLLEAIKPVSTRITGCSVLRGFQLCHGAAG
jgi:hypothetical protein